MNQINKLKCKICNREFKHNEPVFGGKDGYYSCVDHIELKACISCTGGIVCWRCGGVCKPQPKLLEMNGVGMNIEGYTDQQVHQVKEFADTLLTSAIEEERKRCAQVVEDHHFLVDLECLAYKGLSLKKLWEMAQRIINKSKDRTKQKILNPNENSNE